MAYFLSVTENIARDVHRVCGSSDRNPDVLTGP